MNIVSVNGFVKDKKTTSILTCCKKLVSYYLSKGFVILKINPDTMRDVPKGINK